MTHGTLSHHAIRRMVWRRSVSKPWLIFLVAVLWTPFLTAMVEAVADLVFGHPKILHTIIQIRLPSPVVPLCFVIGAYGVMLPYGLSYRKRCRATLCPRCDFDLSRSPHAGSLSVRCTECNLVTDLSAYRKAFPPREPHASFCRSAHELRRMVVLRELFTSWVVIAAFVFLAPVAVHVLAMLDAWHRGAPSNLILRAAPTLTLWPYSAGAVCSATILLALRRASVMRRYRRDVLCPRCASSLRDTPADAYGIMRCPQCGMNVDLDMYRSVFPALRTATMDHTRRTA